MSAATRRHLALVDADTGEVVESQELSALQAEVERLRGALDDAEKDLRVKRRQITELRRDRAKERLEHPLRPEIERVCRYWWRKCRGSSEKVNPLTPDRFDAVEALMGMQRIVPDEKAPRKRRREWLYEFEDFKAAIDGAHFDPFITTLKNGKSKRHDDLALICRSAKNFDSNREKCPYEVAPLGERRDPPDVVAGRNGVCHHPAQGSKAAGVATGSGKQESFYGTRSLGAAPDRALGVFETVRPLVRFRVGGSAAGVPCAV